jgi:hypothetical protein
MIRSADLANVTFDAALRLALEEFIYSVTF